MERRAGGNQHRFRNNFRAVGQFDNTIWVLDAQGFHLLRRQNFGAEALCLCQRAPRQIQARQTGREAQIIFNFGTAARLSARRLAFNHNRLQTFGRRIHRRRKSRRSTPYNRKVVHFARGLCVQTNFFCQLPRRGFDQKRTVRKKYGRNFYLAIQRAFDEQARFGIFFNVEKLIRHLITRKKFFGFVTRLRPLCSRNANAFVWNMRGRLPFREQIIENRIQAFFGRVPRFQ